MSKNITDEDISKIADLIKINIPKGSRGKYATQLNTVLEAMDVLKEVDTKNIEPTSQTHGLVNIMAEDKVESGLNIDDYKNRKNIQGRYFVVNKVIK